MTEKELERADTDYVELERRADLMSQGEEQSLGQRSGKQMEEFEGRMVDVVLSDMSAPWEQTTGFWKRSLSDPYFRMMNTSGMSFRDHAGSMVRLNGKAPVTNQVADTRQDLCNAALQFSFDTLRTGGHFVCKFYQGAEDKGFEARLKALFTKVHREKPESSRSVSLYSAIDAN